MKLNREKIVAAFALVLLLSGSYKVLLGIITPAEGVKKPDITIPETRREIAKPVYRRFSSPEPPSRNPFSFAEGWRPLERLPLRPPPYPAMAQLLPLLGNSPPPGEAGFLYQELPPVDADTAEESSSESSPAGGVEGGR